MTAESDKLNKVATTLGMVMFMLMAIGFIVGTVMRQEKLDDDICEVGEIRAAFTFEAAPGEQHRIVRCVSLSDYEKLEREGRLAPAEEP